MWKMGRKPEKKPLTEMTETKRKGVKERERRREREKKETDRENEKLTGPEWKSDMNDRETRSAEAKRRTREKKVSWMDSLKSFVGEMPI